MKKIILVTSRNLNDLADRTLCLKQKVFFYLSRCEQKHDMGLVKILNSYKLSTCVFHFNMTVCISWMNTCVNIVNIGYRKMTF